MTLLVARYADFAVEVDVDADFDVYYKKGPCLPPPLPCDFMRAVHTVLEFPS